MTCAWTRTLAAVVLVVTNQAACTRQQRPTAAPAAELQGKPIQPDMAEFGASIFRIKGCHMCHAFGRTVAGPDLAGVMERRDHDWLRRWLLETDQMLQTDPQALDMLRQWNGIKMPLIPLRIAEVESLFHYFAQETARVRRSSP